MEKEEWVSAAKSQNLACVEDCLAVVSNADITGEVRTFKETNPQSDTGLACELELELEPKLIQTQMAQKPMLWAEKYARALRASQNVKRAEGRRS